MNCQVTQGSYTTIKKNFISLMEKVTNQEFVVMSANFSSMVNSLYDHIQNESGDNLFKDMKNKASKNNYEIKSAEAYMKTLIGATLPVIIHNSKVVNNKVASNPIEILKKIDAYKKYELKDINSEKLKEVQGKINNENEFITNLIKNNQFKISYTNRQEFEEVIKSITDVLKDNIELAKKVIESYLYVKTLHIPFETDYTEGKNNNLLNLTEGNFTVVPTLNKETGEVEKRVKYQGNDVGKLFTLDLDTTLKNVRGYLREYGIQDGEIDEAIRLFEDFQKKINATPNDVGIEVKMEVNNRKGYVESAESVDINTLLNTEGLQVETKDGVPIVRVDNRPFIQIGGGSIKSNMNPELQAILSTFKGKNPYSIQLTSNVTNEDIRNSQQRLIELKSKYEIIANPSYMKPFTFYSFNPKVNGNFNYNNSGRLMIQQEESFSTTLDTMLENVKNKVGELQNVDTGNYNKQIRQVANFFMNSNVAYRLIDTISDYYVKLDTASLDNLEKEIRDGIKDKGKDYFKYPDANTEFSQNFWVKEGVYYTNKKTGQVNLDKARLVNLLSKMRVVQESIFKNRETGKLETIMLPQESKHYGKVYTHISKVFKDFKMIYNFDLDATTTNEGIEKTLNDTLVITDINAIVKGMTGKDVTIMYGGVPQKPNMSFSLKQKEEIYPDISEQDIRNELSKYNAGITVINVKDIEINIESYLDERGILGRLDKNLSDIKIQNYIIASLKQENKQDLKFCII